MNKLKLAVATFAVLIGVAAVTPVYEVSANANTQILEGAKKTGTEGGATLEVRIGTVTSILLFIIGAISVIMIIVGGIKYVVSNGDSGKVKAAKDTIMYAVVGLVIALLAYAIVSFVLTNVK